MWLELFLWAGNEDGRNWTSEDELRACRPMHCQDQLKYLEESCGLAVTQTYVKEDTWYNCWEAGAKARLGVQGDPLGIVQEIEIWPYEQTVYAQRRICPVEWSAKTPLRF